MTPRPNPFAFPSHTDLRFVLLVASVLGASLYVYTILYLSVPGNGVTFLHALVACQQTAELAYPTDLLTRATAVSECMAPFHRDQALWTALGLASLVALALGIYWEYPWWKIRRGQLQPLLPEDGPELMEYLERMCAEASLRRPPTFLVSPSPTTSGVAFGRRGQYYVTLGSGLVTLFFTSRPTFRAVVLHELAHLRNGDVDKTYLSVAIVLSFAVAALAPLAVVYPATRLAAWRAEGSVPAMSELNGLVWPTLALVLSAYLSWTAILRSREHYADLRAIQIDGPASALPAVLARLPAEAAPLWRRATLTHATGAERRRIVEDPRPLLRIGFWDAFASGMAGVIAYIGLQSYLSPPLSGTWAAAWSSAIASAVFVPLAGGVVGLGIWRSTFAELVGAGSASLRPAGLGLWLGMLAGRALSYEAGVLSPSLGSDPPMIWPSLFLAGVLLATLLYFTHWVRNSAIGWLEISLAGSRPRRFYTVGLLVAGVILSLWLGVVFLVASTLSSADLGPILALVGLGLVFQLPTDPVAFVAVVFLWAYPLAAYLGRGQTRSIPTPEWALMDASGGDGFTVIQSRLPLRPAVLIGAIGGLLSGGLLAALLVFTLGEPPTEEEVTALLFLQLSWVALTQAVVAGVAAARVGRLRVEQGLLAAFVAAVIQTAFRVGYTFATAGPSLSEAWYLLSTIVVLGALFSLVGAGIATAAARLRAHGPGTHGS